MRIRKSLFFFFIIATTTTIAGLFSTYYLPDKYFFDANIIISNPYNLKGLMGSYSFCVWFFNVTGLNKLHFSLIALIQIPIAFFVIRQLGIPNCFARFNLRNGVIWLSLLILGVYLSMPSKEFFNLIYIGLICLILIKNISLKKKIFIVILLFLFFGIWYRPYFIILPVLSIILSILSIIKIRNKMFTNIFGALLAAIFISFSSGLIKGEFLSQGTRERINKDRAGREDSQTIVVSPISTDNIIGEGTGILYGFFSINFPANGLRFFYKPQVLSFVIWQMAMFILLLIFYNRCLKQRKRYSHEIWFFHFLFSYLIIQGIFEPDLGSAVKHKMGVLPLIYLAIYFDQNLLKRPAKFL